MGVFISESQIKLYQYYVKSIRSDFGRPITLHIPGPKRHCPNCLFDSVNNRSAGMFRASNPYPSDIAGPFPFIGGMCPVCNGTGQYTSEITKIIDKALIRWLKVDQKRYLVQGLEADNDLRIKVDIKHRTDLMNSRAVTVDGSRFEVTTILPKGLRDLIYVTVFLKVSQPPPGNNTTDVSKY